MSNTTATVTVTWGSGGNVLYAGTPLNASGETVINETDRKKRFFRIGAEKQ